MAINNLEIHQFPHDVPMVGLFYTESEFNSEEMQTSTVLREIWVVPPRFCIKSLRGLLMKTDQELQEAADLCEATVVPHKWGLVAGSNPFYSPIQVPRNKRVVAEVDRITPADEVPADIFATLHSGVAAYNKKRKSLQHRRYTLSDVTTGQFMYGHNVNDPGNTQDQLFLVDIEPKYRTAHIRLPV